MSLFLPYLSSIQAVNPDAQVQERIRLVFDSFMRLGSAKAAVRYLRQADLALPVRPLKGPAPYEIAWRDATDARVRNILKNPVYAGPGCCRPW